MDLINAKLHQNLTERLPADDGVGACFESCGGRSAGSFLLPPQAGERIVRSGDVNFRSSLGARFGCDHPRYELNTTPTPSTHCNHIYARSHPERAGEICGLALDVKGSHAWCCEVGGAILAGHISARDWLKQTLEWWKPGGYDHEGAIRPRLASGNPAPCAHTSRHSPSSRARKARHPCP